MNPQPQTAPAGKSPSRRIRSGGQLAWLPQSWLLAAALGLSTLGARAQNPGTPLLAMGGEWQYDFAPGGLDPELNQNADGTPLDWKAESGAGFVQIPGHFTASGSARLGFGGDGEVTNINSGAAGASPPITAYFRKMVEIPASMNVETLQTVLLDVACDDGCVVYINGVECCRHNLPPGRITPDTLALEDISGAAEKTPLQVTISPKFLRPGMNSVCCEVHQAAATSDDLGFDLALAADGDPLPCPIDPWCPNGPVVSAGGAESGPWGRQVTLRLATAAGVIPPDTSYRWKLEGRPIPGATASTLVIPACSSQDTGAYECDVTVQGVRIPSTPLQVSCDMPSQVDVQVTDTSITVVGTAGDDQCKIRKFRNSKFMHIVVERSAGSPPLEWEIETSKTGSRRTMVVDMAGGLDLLECDVAANDDGDNEMIAPECRLIGGGQVGDLLVTTEVGGLPAMRPMSWWWKTVVWARGVVTCEGDQKPCPGIPVKFTHSSQGAWGGTLMTNSAGEFFGPLPALWADGGSMEARAPAFPGALSRRSLTAPATFADFGNILYPSCPRCVCPPADMTLWLPFDESSGLTSANRRAAGFPAMAVGGAPVNQAGYVDRSRAFGNYAKHYEVAHYAGLNPGTGNFSVDCWIRRDSGTGATQSILDHRAYANNRVTGWHVAMWQGRLVLQMAQGAAGTQDYQNYASSGAVPNDGAWHLIAITVERAAANGIKFYIDGTLVSTANPATISGSLDVNTQLHVGYSNIGGNIPFMGGVDEVEFFNTRALAATEVTGIFNARWAGKCKCESGWKTLPLKNTGFAANGSLLPVGGVDMNYGLSVLAPNPKASAVIYSYLPNTTTSQWVSAKADSLSSWPTQYYVYTQNVDLTGCDPTTATISGRWACDDAGSIWLNGVQVANSVTTNGWAFNHWQPFSISGGFGPGMNTLEFRVNDAGFGATGVRVEMSGRAWKCCPCDRKLMNFALHNTGVDGAGVVLPDGAVDPFYTVAPYGPTTYTTSDYFGIWLASSATSKWISINPTDSSNYPTVNYTYTQTFNLSGYDAATASITGRFAADDYCEVWLNGSLKAISTGGYTGWTPFTITSGFLPTGNTLEFRVQDLGFGITGLRVEMKGSAYRCLPAAWDYPTAMAALTTDLALQASLAIRSEDTDHDGVINGLEFAQGTDPLNAASKLPTATGLELQPDLQHPVLTMKVCRMMDLPKVFEVESGGDLTAWGACDLISSEPQANGTVQETYRDSKGSPEAGDLQAPKPRTRFIRIKIKD